MTCAKAYPVTCLLGEGGGVASVTSGWGPLPQAREDKKSLCFQALEQPLHFRKIQWGSILPLPQQRPLGQLGALM